MLGERRPLPLEAGRRDVEDGAAPDGDDRRVGAHDEPVAGQRDQRGLEPEARVAGFAGLELGAVHRQHAGHHLLGAGVEADAVAGLDRPRRVLQQLERPVQEQRGRPARPREPARRRARSRPAPRPGGSPRCAARRSRARTAWPCTCRPRTFDCTPRGYTSTFSSTARRPATRVPVTTVPKPLTVKTRSIGSRAVRSGSLARHRARQVGERGPQLGQPLARLHRDGHDRGARRGRCPRARVARRRGPARSSRARPGRPWSATTSPDLMRRSWQIARCSRVCGITPSSAATTSSARSMPPAPASMLRTKRSWPGHVDDLDHEAARLLEEGEAEVDGDAARLLLGQAVGVGAGERLDQRRLAVVDVAGGAHHDVSHGSPRA